VRPNSLAKANSRARDLGHTHGGVFVRAARLRVNQHQTFGAVLAYGVGEPRPARAVGRER
jgi:hypothetical protein